MSVYRVIDKLEGSIKEGFWLPFGGRIVNADRLLDLVEKLRSTLPDDVSRAKQVTRDRDKLLEQAKEEAQTMLAQANETKQKVTSESELTQAAQRQADAIISAAQARARDIQRGADEYADQVLSSLDGSLGKALAAVQKGRQALATGAQAQSARGNGSVTRETTSP